MTNTDLGACEQFVYELRRSNLVERGQLDQVLEEFLRRNPCPDPNTLADRLVTQGVLTRFQAERIQQGKTVGLVLGPYVLTDAIGSGSMGTVHKAQSKTDGKWYAVKVLPRRSMWNVRLARRQVRNFGQFNHQAVVPFVDVGTAGGLHYLVWPFVEGETLEALVQRLGKLSPKAAAYIGQQVAHGLALAHQNNLFHGQLKPSNIMIAPNGVVRILDFGIGSLLAENEGESLVDTMSTANTLTSGLDCASPESIMEPTNRTRAGDQYSLGCTLYWCVSGQYPFAEGSAVEKMMAHQFKQPTPINQIAPDVPPEFCAVVERLMQKKPEDRYAGVDHAAEALSPLAPKDPTFLLDPSAQALTMTPSPMQTKAILAQSKPKSAEIPRPTPSAVVSKADFKIEPKNEPLPSVAPQPPAPDFVIPLPPSTEVAGKRSVKLPTRNSLRPEPAPAEIPENVPSSSLAADAIVAARELVGQRQPTQFQIPKPLLGPLGFLALGATVALACFMVVHNLMK